ncbi:hypothetical protein V8E36_006837 [Tilletia maclaganii]
MLDSRSRTLARSVQRIHPPSKGNLTASLPRSPVRGSLDLMVVAGTIHVLHLLRARRSPQGPDPSSSPVNEPRLWSASPSIGVFYGFRSVAYHLASTSVIGRRSARRGPCDTLYKIGEYLLGAWILPAPDSLNQTCLPLAEQVRRRTSPIKASPASFPPEETSSPSGGARP